ncbi:hypothetical protein K402DRAFT_404829 [Aulographum hederae CBS 113979]|uniref:RING-type domain-containing protein n=1 Tax=Aulographum hederae CBS 113979 TaxID=1176131 RepID=A0A6G1GYP6_9PEZI|nr:hypothetical protein K402DRAFT_404829 [Aulographum hederae CBS 113979]
MLEYYAILKCFIIPTSLRWSGSNHQPNDVKPNASSLAPKLPTRLAFFRDLSTKSPDSRRTLPDDEVCPMCHCPFNEVEEDVFNFPCSHLFCSTCVTSWYDGTPGRNHCVSCYQTLFFLPGYDEARTHPRFNLLTVEDNHVWIRIIWRVEGTRAIWRYVRAGIHQVHRDDLEDRYEAWNVQAMLLSGNLMAFSAEEMRGLVHAVHDGLMQLWDAVFNARASMANAGQEDKVGALLQQEGGERYFAYHGTFRPNELLIDFFLSRPWARSWNRYDLGVDNVHRPVAWDSGLSPLMVMAALDRLIARIANSENQRALVALRSDLGEAFGVQHLLYYRVWLSNGISLIEEALDRGDGPVRDTIAQIHRQFNRELRVARRDHQPFEYTVNAFINVL